MGDKYFDLGGYSRSITTQSKQAQTWFNRGLVWCYGFNQEEAGRCFEKVVELDPNCAMGYWGLAYAAGPFYNKPWHWFGERERIHTIAWCNEQIQHACEHAARATPVERALINALVQKHQKPSAEYNLELENWMQSYADSMRKVCHEFPDDLDVICLTAEAIVNLTPWQLWDLQRGIPARDAGTEEAISILQRGLARVEAEQLTPHPGILHFYIHVYEMSPTPEKALPYANQLRNLCPDCGHLRHMASHIDSLCGHWQDGADANDHAIRADRNYMDIRGTDEFYMISVVHNYDFKIWSAMFLGQFGEAIAAADSICDLVREKRTVRDKWYLSSTLEGYYAGRAHVMVRFGKWQEICDEAMPDDPETVPITTILLVYAKAIAFATLGDFENARHYQKQFNNLYQKIPEWHVMANNLTRKILAVGEAMMNGEIEYHAGNYELGFLYLREATTLCDNLNYSEPWPWMHPPRHALGALLLEQGRTEEAILHYQDDLGIGNRLPRCTQHPDNIWALHGYYECLQRFGREEEAMLIKPRLDELINNSDIEINSSCCCRKDTLL